MAIKKLYSGEKRFYISLHKEGDEDPWYAGWLEPFTEEWLTARHFYKVDDAKAFLNYYSEELKNCFDEYSPVIRSLHLSINGFDFGEK